MSCHERGQDDGCLVATPRWVAFGRSAWLSRTRGNVSSYVRVRRFRRNASSSSPKEPGEVVQPMAVCAERCVDVLHMNRGTARGEVESSSGGNAGVPEPQVFR